MAKVLNNGAAGSNLQRLEVGDDPIPTSFNVFKLQKPPPLAPYIKIDNIRSLQCVTYIPDETLRLTPVDSGYYVNVFPWIPWKKGKKLPLDAVMEGTNAYVRTEKEQKLSKEHKVAGSLSQVSFDRLLKQHTNRLSLLQEMGLRIKESLNPRF